MKKTTPRRITKINSYLSTPLNQRINRRAQNQQTIKQEYTELIGDFKRKKFTQKQAATALGESERTIRFFIQKGKIVTNESSTKRRGLITREELRRFSKERELNLGPSEAYLLFKKIAGEDIRISQKQFLGEAQKQGILKRENKFGFAKINFADFVKFTLRLKQVFSYPTTREIAKQIGMTEKALLENLATENELKKHFIHVGSPKGGLEVRLPPELVKIILRRQSGLTTSQAINYLKAKGVNLTPTAYLRWIKKGIIKANSEKGIDGRIRISTKALDEYIANKDTISLERNQTKRKRISVALRKRKKSNKPVAKYNYASEKARFLEKHQKMGLTPKMYDLFVLAYKLKFKNWKRQETPSTETIASAIWPEIRSKTSNSNLVYSFADWVATYKWKEIVSKK